MSGAAEEAVSGLPPELLNNDPSGFAWGVWHDRTPKLITRIKDAHPYGPDQRRALDSLLEEIRSGVMQPSGPMPHDHRQWASWGAGYFGKPWLDTPFLWSESYFYRRLLDAVELLFRAFRQRLADHLPNRVMPVSTEAPQDILALVNSEYANIAELLKPGRRARGEARAKIRTLLALEAHVDEDTKVSDSDVNRVEKGIKTGKTRQQVFPKLNPLSAAIR